MSELLTGIDVAAMADAFAGEGSVRLRVRGVVREVKLRTAGWEKARDAWKKRHPAPKPPYKDEMLVTGSPEHKLFGAKGPTTVRRYDTLDEEFVRKTREHVIDSYYAITAHCLVLELTDGGALVTDLEKRIEALKKLGMTEKHVDEITDIVQELSGLAEAEAADFGGPDSGPPTS